MRLTWLTDIHLNFLQGHAIYEFFDAVGRERPDAVVVSGDIGEAQTFSIYLQEMQEALQCPVHFVLGNHDFYRGSLATVTERAAVTVRHAPGLSWLTRAGVVELTPRTALVGHDGWYDGRAGDYQRSGVMLNDFYLIWDFLDLDKQGRLGLLNRLGDESASHFLRVLPEALRSHEEVILATHVPPFREACWHEGHVSGEDWLPFMCCQAAGEVLCRIMGEHPDRRLTVLCGHTHGQGEAMILPNLKVLTGGAAYRSPAVQRVIELA
ncbi:MAG: metallophosphoesterase family protein [Tepidisphaerales bacterium]